MQSLVVSSGVPPSKVTRYFTGGPLLGMSQQRYSCCCVGLVRAVMDTPTAVIVRTMTTAAIHRRFFGDCVFIG